MNARTIPPAALALTFAMGAAALAQLTTFPADSDRGTRFGVQQVNNSGQVGTVTVFPHGKKSLVVIRLARGQSRGKTQQANLSRFLTCDESASATSPMPLKPSVDGVSSTIVDIPFDRLLSGNYGVLVRSVGNTINVACGHIDQTLNP